MNGARLSAVAFIAAWLLLSLSSYYLGRRYGA